MDVARLSAIFTLILHIQVSYGQQLSLLGLNNKPGLTLNNGPLGAHHQALQRKAGLISNFNQIPKSGAGSNLLQQQSNILNSQQSGNLQSLNLQQPLNCQQQLNLQQQPLNVNLQQAPQNNNCQSLNLQQQQNCVPVSNLQLLSQQAPVSTCDVSLSSFPTVNGQISGLPSQVSQGTLLSNLGLTSSLSTLLQNSSPQQLSDQISLVLPQNNLGSISNVPISLINGPQTNASPISISSSALNAAFNSPTSSLTIPVSLQNTLMSQQTQQALNLAQNSLMTQQSYPIQNQISSNSVPAQPFQVQSQPSAASVQSQPLMPSFILSPNAYSQVAPGSSAYRSSIVSPQPSNHGSKSSNIKALLPLLFKLLNEKPSCCGRRQNNNCGCTNNNNNSNNVPQPQVSGGYSKQINYSQSRKEDSTNTIDSEEFDISENLRKRRIYRKYKNRYNDSTEYDADDYAEDYDNED